jgi:nucleotide-binding universal stress UspA family protein
MYSKILVPLDGSEMAEAALLHAVALAGPLKAAIHLLRVVPLPAGRSGGAFKAAAAFLRDVKLPRSETDLDLAKHPVYREAEMASLEAEAKGELLRVAEELQAQGMAVEVAVVFGRPAGGILRYAHDAGIDLIVLSTHGEGGADAYAYGSTADRVARRAATPVLLVRPEAVSRVLPLPPGVEEMPL